MDFLLGPIQQHNALLRGLAVPGLVFEIKQQSHSAGTHPPNIVTFLKIKIAKRVLPKSPDLMIQGVHHFQISIEHRGMQFEDLGAQGLMQNQEFRG